MEPLSPTLNPIFHGCPDPMNAKHNDRVALALEEYFLDEED
jgi:hypothetical protein